jgi:hypothetical protein
VAMGFAIAESVRSSSASLRRRLSWSSSRVDGRPWGAHRWSPDLRWVGDGVNKRGERGHSSDAVGDGVVHLDEEPDPVVRQASQERHLPQGPAPVERATPEPLAGEKKMPFVAGGRDLVGADVLGDVEGPGIAPHRPPQPEFGPAGPGETVGRGAGDDLWSRGPPQAETHRRPRTATRRRAWRAPRSLEASPPLQARSTSGPARSRDRAGARQVRWSLDRLLPAFGWLWSPPHEPG